MDKQARVIEELLKRVAAVIDLSSMRLKTEPVEERLSCYLLVHNNFSSIAGEIRKGGPILNSIGKGARLGAGRAMSEWDLDDPDLQQAVRLAEDVFETGLIAPSA